jgi:hypothetical protein
MTGLYIHQHMWMAQLVEFFPEVGQRHPNRLCGSGQVAASVAPDEKPTRPCKAPCGGDFWETLFAEV